MTAIATLRSLGACSNAINWASRRRGRSPQRLWEECDRADWMAWHMGKLAERDGHGSPAHRRAVLVACLCARTASRHWRSPACERAVSLAELWAWGDETVTRDDLRAAAYAAAADAAAAARAAAYADAAADAAAAAYAAAYAAAAVDAAVAAYAAAAAARTSHLASLADMIRAAVPEVPL